MPFDQPILRMSLDEFKHVIGDFGRREVAIATDLAALPAYTYRYLPQIIQCIEMIWWYPGKDADERLKYRANAEGFLANFTQSVPKRPEHGRAWIEHLKFRIIQMIRAGNDPLKVLQRMPTVDSMVGIPWPETGLDWDRLQSEVRTDPSTWEFKFAQEEKAREEKRKEERKIERKRRIEEMKEGEGAKEKKRRRT